MTCFSIHKRNEELKSYAVYKREKLRVTKGTY